MKDLKPKVRNLYVSQTLGWSYVYCYESMKRKLIYNLYMNVGVMKDYKLRELRASHTLVIIKSMKQGNVILLT